MHSFRVALRICAKDLRQRLRDRSAFVLAVVLPLTLAFVFGLVFGSADTPRAFEYAVVDLDHGPVAQAFTRDVLTEVERSGAVRVRRVATAAEARRLAAEGTIDAAFVLPAGFSAAVQARGGARMEVIGNADSPTGVDVAGSIARSFTADLNAVRVAVAAAAPNDSAGAPEQMAAAARRAVAAARPVAVEDVSARRKILDAKTYFAAGMAVFFLFFTVQFGISSLLDERNDGTLSRLLAAPVSPGAILGGKLLTSFVLGTVSMAVLVIATTVLVGASWGNPFAVALLVLAGVLSATAVAALVASLARSVEQAGSWQSVVAVSLGLLGGAFFPIGQVGGVAAALSLATPHAWFFRGLGELAGDDAVGSVFPAVGAMLALAAVVGAVAAYRLPKAVRP